MSASVSRKPHRVRRGASLAERIALLTEKGPGCWRWLGGFNTSGYGQITYDGRTIGAHRAAWELERGPVPAGLCIDHLCRNRACVNPAHMETVPNHENVARGRSTRLSEAEVVAMRRLRAEGATLRALGERFGVSKSNAGHVARRDSWRHLLEPAAAGARS